MDPLPLGPTQYLGESSRLAVLTNKGTACRFGASHCPSTGVKRGLFGTGSRSDGGTRAGGGSARAGNVGVRNCPAAFMWSARYSILPRAAQAASQVRPALCHCQRKASGTCARSKPNANSSSESMLFCCSQVLSSSLPLVSAPKRGDIDKEEEESIFLSRNGKLQGFSSHSN